MKISSLIIAFLAAAASSVDAFAPSSRSSFAAGSSSALPVAKDLDVIIPAAAAAAAAAASAAAAEAPPPPASSSAPSSSSPVVDRAMDGIDDDLGYPAFDPTAGGGPAVDRNNAGGVWVRQRARPRRNRKSAGVRAMVRENVVTPSNFIYPLFIHDDAVDVPIPSMPGCARLCAESVMREVGESLALGVRAFVLFPKVNDALKTNLAREAYNPNGIVHRTIRAIKSRYPEAVVCTDVALDPYSDQGHDGVVEDGVILNDVTVNQLCKQAVSQARAGADIVAPSDMQVSGPNPPLGIYRAFAVVCGKHRSATDVARAPSICVVSCVPEQKVPYVRYKTGVRVFVERRKSTF
jgi:hypothetical protein